MFSALVRAPRKKRFCSRACAPKYRRATPPPVRVGEVRRCVECSATLVGIQRSACSTACARYVQARARRERYQAVRDGAYSATYEFACEQCGKHCSAPKRRGARPKMCSAECKYARDVEMHRARVALRLALRERRCAECGVSFPVGKSDGMKRYCTKRCARQKFRVVWDRAATCVCCGQSFDRRRPGYKTCGPECRRKWRLVTKSSPHEKAATRIRTGIRHSLRKKGAKKDGRAWQEVVGYSTAELMAHLEAQFAPGMSWDNMSEWHIDHIRPVSSFHFTSMDDPELAVAWALDNLRPLWAEDNFKKGARYADAEKANQPENHRR